MLVPRTRRISVVVVIVGIVFIIFERHGLLTNKITDQIILFLFVFSSILYASTCKYANAINNIENNNNKIA